MVTHAFGPAALRNAGNEGVTGDALKTGVDGSNGVYVSGAGGVFPHQGTSGYNFRVDVVCLR